MPSGRRRKRPDAETPTFFLDRSLGRVQSAWALRERGILVITAAERIDRHLYRLLQRARNPGPYAYVLHDKQIELRWPATTDT